MTPTSQMECCPDPKISNLHFGDTNNYFCHSCKAHLYGKSGEERFYTKREWELWINSEDEPGIN